MDKDLEKWYKVFISYKDTPYIGFILEYFDELYLQAFNVWMELSKYNYGFNEYEYLGFNDILNISAYFLSTINKNYGEYLDKHIKYGVINIYDASDEYDLNDNKIGGRFIGPYYSKYTIDYDYGSNYFKNISLPLKHTIDDVYSIVHEFFHSQNASLKYDSNDFKVLTESVSITYEFILYDYLKNKNIMEKDIIKPILFRLNDFKNKSQRLAQGLIIFKKIKDNIEQFKDIKITEEDKESIRKDYKSVRSVLEYYLGTLIAILTYKKYKEGIINISDIERYSYSLCENNELESLKILFDKFPDINEVKDAIGFIKSQDIIKSK